MALYTFPYLPAPRMFCISMYFYSLFLLSSKVIILTCRASWSSSINYYNIFLLNLFLYLVKAKTNKLILLWALTFANKIIPGSHLESFMKTWGNPFIALIWSKSSSLMIISLAYILVEVCTELLLKYSSSTANSKDLSKRLWEPS